MLLTVLTTLRHPVPQQTQIPAVSTTYSITTCHLDQITIPKTHLPLPSHSAHKQYHKSWSFVPTQLPIYSTTKTTMSSPFNNAPAPEETLNIIIGGISMTLKEATAFLALQSATQRPLPPATAAASTTAAALPPPSSSVKSKSPSLPTVSATLPAAAAAFASSFLPAQPYLGIAATPETRAPTSLMKAASTPQAPNIAAPTNHPFSVAPPSIQSISTNSPFNMPPQKTNPSAQNHHSQRPSSTSRTKALALHSKQEEPPPLPTFHHLHSTTSSNPAHPALS